jgi:hypothetical protein
MDYLSMISSLLGTLTVAAGSGVAIGFALFKFFGEKWIQAKFDMEKQALRSQQDENLRHVQSFIDREMHRAKKLYDREFDVVSEAWARLCKNFDNCVACGKYCEVFDFDDLNIGDLEIMLTESKMTALQKSEIQAADDPTIAATLFRHYFDYGRYSFYMNERRDLYNFVRDNGMYMPPGLQERFHVIDPLIGNTLVEFREGVMQTHQNYDSWRVLERDGRPLQDEISALIKARLWSSEAGVRGGNEENA